MDRKDERTTFYIQLAIVVIVGAVVVFLHWGIAGYFVGFVIGAGIGAVEERRRLTR